MRVLTYHRVALPKDDPHLDPGLISATPQDFERQMEYLARRYEVVSIDEVLGALDGGRLPSSRAVMITFDDGYRDFVENAWPVLKAYGLPAVLFVPTAYPDHPERPFWWDRLYSAVNFTHHIGLRDALLGVRPGCATVERTARLKQLCSSLKAMPHTEAMACVDKIVNRLEADLPLGHRLLTWNELRKLSEHGITVAAHTRTHPILNQLTEEEMRKEICGSQEDLVRQLGRTHPVFCYPSGQYDEGVVQILRQAGFRAAFTTLDGHNDLGRHDPLRLCRTNITLRTTLPIFRLRLLPGVSHLDSFRHRRNDRRGIYSNLLGGTMLQTSLRQPTPEADIGKSTSAALQSLPRVAYIMSRFPKLTETFVLYEILKMKELGLTVEIYPLLHEHQPVTHPAAEELVRQANYRPFVSLSILLTHLHFIRRQPVVYFKTLFEVLWHTLPSPWYFLGAVVYFPKAVHFAYEMAQKRIEHIHAHFVNHPAMVAFVIHRLTGIPFSFTAHGTDLQVDQVMLPSKVAAAQVAIAISQYNKELIIAKCGERFRGKVHVIHCGVDPDVFSARKTNEGGPLQIACVASLGEVKGHKYLIEACRILKSRGVHFVCHLAGEGPLLDSVKHQIKEANLNECVNLRGPLPRAAVVELLGQTDVVVLPSIPLRDGQCEGIPVALMEAMACGLPVVSSAIGGIPELVESGRTGILVPPRDAEALADALQTFADNPQLRMHMGNAGREKVMAEFNLHRNAELLKEHFCQSVQEAVPAFQPCSETEIPADPGLSSAVGLNSGSAQSTLARRPAAGNPHLSVSSNAFEVLILDGNQRSALAATRSLGKKGVRVVVGEDQENTLAGCSRYCSERVVYPSPARNSERFVRALREEVQKRNIKVLLPMTEITTAVVLKYQESFPSVRIPFASYSAFDRLADKWRVMELAQGLGVSIPETHFIRGQEELGSISKSLEYPVVLKPSRSRIHCEGRWIEASVKYANSAQELWETVRCNHCFAHHPFLVQKLIRGQGHGIFALYQHGRPILFFAHRRLREKPPTGGVSVLSESVAPDPQAVTAARKILDCVVWHGVAMVEFKVSADGTPYLMEVNPRFWGSLQLAVDAGVDFPWLAYQMATGVEPELPGRYTTGIRNRWLVGDAAHLVRAVFPNGSRVHLSPSERLRSVVGFLNFFSLNTHYEINRWDDLRPCWAELRQLGARLSPSRTFH